MDTSDENLRSTSSFVSRGLYCCCVINSANTSCLRNSCVISDCMESCIEKAEKITVGSSVEGTITTTSDIDTMIVEPNMLVVQNRIERTGCYRNAGILMKSDCSPGYTRIQVLDENLVGSSCVLLKDFQKLFEATSDGVFLSSEKYVKYRLDDRSMDAKKFKRHGPCISYAVDDYSGRKIDVDKAYAVVCNLWPDEKMEWFTRDRQHEWPSKTIVNKIRKKDCHVVPVGDPTSKHSCLEWRFSFILAERQLMWNFNDTQIQCYFILKLLIQKYINPIVPDRISSYHLKTIMFWQSENLGISVWREDQLLHRVLDCLSYLSKCVRVCRLEHYFYRSNNLFRNKLIKSDDRKFVLNTITTLENNLTAKVLEVFQEINHWRVNSNSDESNLMQLKRMLQSMTPLGYRDLKYFHEKYTMYSTDILFLFFNVARNFKEVDKLQLVLKAFKEKPPADVDPKYVKKCLHFMGIRLAFLLYSTTLNSSLSKEARKNLIGQSFLHMESGVSIDDLVGKLYLATLHFCLKEYARCENLILQAVKKRHCLFYGGDFGRMCFFEVCRHDLKVVRKEIPRTVDITTEITFPLVFSKEDIDIVPYPLKFECAIMSHDCIYPVTLQPYIYAFALLFMTQLLMKHRRLARKYLTLLAETVDQDMGLGVMYRAYNILGYCYSLDGQWDKAITCYINSLKYTRKLPFRRKNAALYHLAILCFDIYTEKRFE